MAKRRTYCFTMALRGSVRIERSACFDSGCMYVSTGKRPTNSGIRPYDLRSCGMMYFIRLLRSTVEPFCTP